jgi:type II secretory pathway component PulC
VLLTTGIRVLRIALALACLGMLYAGVSAAFKGDPIEPVELPAPEPADARDLSFARFAPIAQRDLFGTALPEADTELEPVPLGEELPESSAPYTLVGTVAMSDPKRSIATLEHTRRNDIRGAFLVGDPLEDGYRLEAVEQRRVVVSKSGERSQISMDEEQTGAGAADARRGSARPARRASTSRTAAERRAAARRRAEERSGASRAEQVAKMREQVDAEREEEVDEPPEAPPGSARLQTLMDNMQMAPMQEEGELTGIRVESTNPDGPFGNMAAGTICHELNGVHLSQMHVAIQSLTDDEEACMRCTTPSGQETVTCF